MSRIYRTLGTVAMTPKGEYDSSAYYERLDIVIYNGSSYVAIQSTNGNLPTNTTYWQLLAQKGAKTYNTVAEMKADTDLKDGMSAQTLGYYSVNDGGGATYKITSTESQNEYQEELENGLYATLIINGEVNPNQFGAYGDDIHDDSEAIQKAIDYVLSKYPNDYSYTPKIKGGNYYVTNQIVINSPSQYCKWNIEFAGIKGNYAGYLIDIKGNTSCTTLKIDNISNDLGGCIQCISDTQGITWYGTSKIICGFMRANINYDCIHFETDITTNDSWINEIEIDVLRFNYGRWGFYGKGCHQLIFNHNDFEYGGCCLDACNGALFIAPHMGDPVISECVLKTLNECTNLNIIGGTCGRASWEENYINNSKFEFSNSTDGGIVSYQVGYNLPSSLINKSPFINIIGGKLIRIQPYLLNINVGAGVFDTRNLTSLQCPTSFTAAATTTDIILDKAIYGGYGKINEFIIYTANSTLNIKTGNDGDADGSLTIMKTFTSPLYKPYKFTWLREGKWNMEEMTYETVNG